MSLGPSRSSAATSATPPRDPDDDTMPPLPPLAFPSSCKDGDTEETAEETLSLLSSSSKSASHSPTWRVQMSDMITREDDRSNSVLISKGTAGHLPTEWDVLGTTTVCCKSSVVEIVSFRNANYGLRWTPMRRRRRQDEDSEGKIRASLPFCMVGPHWWLMAGTFMVLLIAALVVTVLTVPQAGPGEAATGVILSAACLTMYAKVGCTNPGFVEHLDEPLRADYTYCGECESYRPPEALHCMECRVCIDGYDHHCPWTGKCVGKGNVKYFYAWLFFLVLAFVYEMIEFTTYMLPPQDQPHPSMLDDDDDSFSLRKIPTSPSPMQPSTPVFRRP